MHKLHLFLPVFLLLTSCASSNPRYQINVGNGSPDKAIRDVHLTVDGREWGRFASIAPSKLAASKPRNGALPGEMNLTWKDAEGVDQAATISSIPLTSGDFRGQLVVQIEADQSVNVIPVPATDARASILPWAVPEAWEGSIGIPGMDQQ